MANTTNFGWETPDDTDLVKDGAAAMRTLGNSIDASFVDLKGGTTGQVLAKASNTDLDFTWTAGGDITGVTAGTGISGGGTSGDVTITNSMATTIDAKGDLIAGTGADAFARLAVGANNTVLIADSATATGLKWGTPAAGADNWVLIQGQSVTSVSSVTFSSLTSYKLLFLTCSNFWSSATTNQILVRVNSDSTNNYMIASQIKSNNGTRNSSGMNSSFITNYFAGTTAGDRTSIGLLIEGCNSSGNKPFSVVASGTDSSSQIGFVGNGIYLGSSAISSLSITMGSGTISSSSGNGNEFQLWGVVG